MPGRSLQHLLPGLIRLVRCYSQQVPWFFTALSDPPSLFHIPPTPCASNPSLWISNFSNQHGAPNIALCRTQPLEGQARKKKKKKKAGQGLHAGWSSEDYWSLWRAMNCVITATPLVVKRDPEGSSLDEKGWNVGIRRLGAGGRWYFGSPLKLTV